MDPNTTLENIRLLVAGINNETSQARLADMAVVLAEKVEALDEWLTRQGYFPQPWGTDRLTTGLPAVDTAEQMGMELTAKGAAKLERTD